MEAERKFGRTILLCAFPVTVSLLVFSLSAMWAGILRPGDPHFANIGGLVPFSDASNYLADAYDQVRDGAWITVSSHRPIAAALRSVLLFFTNYSFQGMLILQCCLLGIALCFAARAVAIWRGLWVGVAFFGLTYIYVRTFASTTLTEPLGLIWALLSIPFFIEAFVSRSVKPALIAFALTTIAMMTRMGSMFTIPALMLWLVWQFGNSAAAKVRIGIVSIGIVIGILSFNALLNKAYGIEGSSTGSNFSYTVCGLTLGTNWTGCPAKLAAEGTPLQRDEATYTRQLYSLAWKNFQSQPDVFTKRLADGVGAFASQFPEIIWKGYLTALGEPAWLWRNLLTSMSLVGLFVVAASRARVREMAFWTLFWFSILSSAALVYFDDGARVLAASHPFVTLFFALGLSSPGPGDRERALTSWSSRYGWLGLTLVAGVCVLVPWIAHRYPPQMTGWNNPIANSDEAVVLGGRRISGFLVVEDGAPLRDDIPSLHLSNFDAFLRQSGVEYYQGLIHPTVPPLPFGFVFAPRTEKGATSAILYIVPAEVIERRDVPAWHFELKRRGHKSEFGEYWFYVTKAEPWPLQSDREISR